VNREIHEQLDLLNHLLSDVQKGQRDKDAAEVTEQAALRQVDSQPRETQDSVHCDVSSAIETRPDSGRERRKGAPEVIFGETKTTEQILSMARGLLAGTGRAIISRMPARSLEAIKEAFVQYEMRYQEASRMMVIYAPEYMRRSTGGRVGMISAGTSDIPVAEEAAMIAEEMGCKVTRIYDVGVAGLHRLIEPLRSLLEEDIDVILVVAGMDGALPSVIAGLSPVPVIGVPTSVGYGMGGKGVAALLSMLQTCAPGLTVVNIDNGVGAGITAGMIANRVAHMRGSRP